MDADTGLVKTTAVTREDSPVGRHSYRKAVIGSMRVARSTLHRKRILATLRKNQTMTGGQQSWMACTTTSCKNRFSGSIFKNSMMRNCQGRRVTLSFIGGPWKIDLFKTNLIKEEFEPRGKVELFEVAEAFVLNSLND
jgi:hypothetical protein